MLEVIFLQQIFLNTKRTSKKQKQHGYDHNVLLLDFTQITDCFDYMCDLSKSEQP